MFIIVRPSLEHLEIGIQGGMDTRLEVTEAEIQSKMVGMPV
jgi:hypothetical protein